MGVNLVVLYVGIFLCEVENFILFDFRGFLIYFVDKVVVVLVRYVIVMV